MSTRYLRLDDILRRLFFKERELVRNALSSLGVVKIVFDNVLLYPHCYPEVWFEDRVECYEGEEAPEPLGSAIKSIMRIVERIDAERVVIYVE